MIYVSLLWNKVLRKLTIFKIFFGNAFSSELKSNWIDNGLKHIQPILNSNVNQAIQLVEIALSKQQKQALIWMMNINDQEKQN